MFNRFKNLYSNKFRFFVVLAVLVTLSLGAVVIAQKASENVQTDVTNSKLSSLWTPEFIALNSANNLKVSIPLNLEDNSWTIFVQPLKEGENEAFATATVDWQEASNKQIPLLFPKKINNANSLLNQSEGVIKFTTDLSLINRDVILIIRADSNKSIDFQSDDTKILTKKIENGFTVRNGKLIEGAITDGKSMFLNIVKMKNAGLTANSSGGKQL